MKFSCYKFPKFSGEYGIHCTLDMLGANAIHVHEHRAWPTAGDACHCQPVNLDPCLLAQSTCHSFTKTTFTTFYVYVWCVHGMCVVCVCVYVWVVCGCAWYVWVSWCVWACTVCVCAWENRKSDMDCLAKYPFLGKIPNYASIMLRSIDYAS